MVSLCQEFTVNGQLPPCSTAWNIIHEKHRSDSLTPMDCKSPMLTISRIEVVVGILKDNTRTFESSLKVRPMFLFHTSVLAV
jgi:hypothetical protein